MSLHSIPFVMVFLPIVLLTTHVAGRLGTTTTVRIWLVLVSLAFYAVNALVFLPLLIGSVLVNFLVGRHLARSGEIDPDARGRSTLVIAGIAANLALLAGLKLIAGGPLASWTGHSLVRVAIPLAVSFYTIHQIVFLVDAYRTDTGPVAFVDYAWFVTFFPRLIAGPFTRFADVVSQPQQRGLRSDDVAVGVATFAAGLLKKVMIADRLGPFADGVFGAAAAGVSPSFAEAWLGATAYAFQIYFDFSGYSDMAIGVARMFGVTLPVNFAMPYRSASLVEFWRRWHITLSSLFFELIYFPMAAALRAPGAAYIALLLTMLVCGLWHGVGWTFLVWGAIHGVGLAVNHAWRRFRTRTNAGRPNGLEVAAGAALTFAVVLVGWVWFRAADAGAAVRLMASMSGGNGLSFELPNFGAPRAPSRGLMYLALAACVTWSVPDTPAWIAQAASERGTDTWWTWRPTVGWGVALASVTLMAMYLSLNRTPTFLYFQF